MGKCDECGGQPCRNGAECDYLKKGRCKFCHCDDDVDEDWCAIGEHEITSYYQDYNGEFICSSCADYCEFGQHYYIGDGVRCDGCGASFCENCDELEECNGCGGHFCAGGPGWGSCGCWPDGNDFLCNDCGGFPINEPQEDYYEEPEPPPSPWEQFDMTKEEWEANRKMADDA